MAEASTPADYAAFCTVRKNRDACIHWLLRLAQQIERIWQDIEARQAGLSLLRQCLQSLAEHAHADCRELAALAPRMLRSLDFEERHFLNLMLPIERKYSKGLRDDEFLLGTGAGAEFLVHTDDRPASAAAVVAEPGSPSPSASALRPAARPVPPLVLVLDHLRSAFNVGAIFRTAECIGVSRLILCGYTATPSDPQVVRTSMGTHAMVDWCWRATAEQAIAELSAEGIPLVALETVEGAPYAHDFAFPAGGCGLLLGNERHGLDPRLLALCSAVVRLPCRGSKNSLNVGVAFGMCGYEIMRQWTSGESSATSS